MSIASLALRLCTVKALHEQTFAGVNVFDSQMDPILFDRFTADNPQLPYVIVYTNEDGGKIDGKNWLDADHTIELVIELYIGSLVQAEDGESQSIDIPHTDAGMEAALNLLERQIMRALLASETIWAQHWRDLITSMSNYTLKRGASVEKGVRFAAHQIVLSCNVVCEPAFAARDAVAGTIWDQIVDTMKADTDLSDIGKLVEANIFELDLTEWKAVAASLGVNRGVAQRIGFGPMHFEAEADEEPAEMTVAVVPRGDETSEYDEAALDANLPPEDG